MNIKLDRNEVCRLLVALASITETEGTGKVYMHIYNKLKHQLEEWDKKRETAKGGKV